MKRTTVYLPDDVAHRLKRVARQRHLSEAQMIRDAIAHLVADEETRLPKPHWGDYDTPGNPDDAERVDEILAEGFGKQ